MSADTESRTPRIEIRPPRFLTPLTMLIVWAFGLLLVIPLIVSALVVSLYSFGSHTLILPVVAVLGATWFLPFGFGNPYVSRLIRSQRGSLGSQERFIVQLKLTPRMATGLRAVIDDADDFGSLMFNSRALLYEGDSVTLEIPYDSICAAKALSIGWRGLFLYEPRIAVTVRGLPDIDQLEFTERSSWVLPTSRKVSKVLYQRLSAAVPNAARS